jgi:hypothetical protein
MRTDAACIEVMVCGMIGIWDWHDCVRCLTITGSGGGVAGSDSSSLEVDSTLVKMPLARQCINPADAPTVVAYVRDVKVISCLVSND